MTGVAARRSPEIPFCMIFVILLQEQTVLSPSLRTEESPDNAEHRTS